MNQMFCINNNQRYTIYNRKLSLKIAKENSFRARINNVRDNKLRLLWECKTMQPSRKHLDSFLVTALKMSITLIQ